MTRGRWVVLPEAGITDEGPGSAGYYDILLAELRRRGEFVRLDLPGHGFARTVQELALGRNGVVLFTFQHRLELFGRTRTRVLRRGPIGTFSDLRVRGRTASWVQDGRRRTARFRIEHGRLAG